MKEQRDPLLPHQQFSPALWQQLDQMIARAAELPVADRIAAFDADGTLWDTDLGEAFFDYEIKSCPLDGLPADPWKVYEDGKKVDTRAAYLWLAQINRGQPIERVHQWAEESVARFNPLPIFESQRMLIKKLQDAQFTLYVVTASIQWAVIPGAKRVNIPADKVLGIRTRVTNGIVQNEQDGPMTWREGKAEAILQATAGKSPLFCSGNTTGDTALLELARHGRLAVRSRNNLADLEKSELDLHTIAQKIGWMTHTF